jgi:hypothetical protein
VFRAGVMTPILLMVFLACIAVSLREKPTIAAADALKLA